MDNTTRTKTETEIREEIYNQIIEYKDTCVKNGISNYFISGLEVSADIALKGEDRQKEQKETLF
jgi:hypothetical protein